MTIPQWEDCTCNWLEDGCPTCAGCQDTIRIYRAGAIHWGGKHWHDRCLLTHLIDLLRDAEKTEDT